MDRAKQKEVELAKNRIKEIAEEARELRARYFELKRKGSTEYIKETDYYEEFCNLYRYTESNFTVRETEVMLHLLRRMKNREIAQKLFISEKCVKFHLSSVYKKLGVSSRLEAFYEIAMLMANGDKE